MKNQNYDKSKFDNNMLMNDLEFPKPGEAKQGSSSGEEKSPGEKGKRKEVDFLVQST